MGHPVLFFCFGVRGGIASTNVFGELRIIIVGVTVNNETVRRDGIHGDDYQNKGGCPILRSSAGWEVLWELSA
jgi:hypothetical protein